MFYRKIRVLSWAIDQVNQKLVDEVVARTPQV